MSAEVITLPVYDDAESLVFTTFVPKHKLDATAAPSNLDDDADGYAPSSIWADTTNERVYVCSNNATGAAVWKEVGGSAGNSGLVYSNTSSTITDMVDTFSGTYEIPASTMQVGDVIRFTLRGHHALYTTHDFSYDIKFNSDTLFSSPNYTVGADVTGGWSAEFTVLVTAVTGSTVSLDCNGKWLFDTETGTCVSSFIYTTSSVDVDGSVNITPNVEFSFDGTEALQSITCRQFLIEYLTAP